MFAVKTLTHQHGSSHHHHSVAGSIFFFHALIRAHCQGRSHPIVYELLEFLHIVPCLEIAVTWFDQQSANHLIDMSFLG